MKNSFFALVACGWLCASASGVAEVKPASLFTDHMVLQRGTDAPVWGTAAAGEAVTVSLHGQIQSTTTGKDGHWMVHLRKLQAGGPYEMRIAGANTIVLKDVMVGEVWLASGQSNMVFTISAKAASFAGMTDEDKEIAAANHPDIRMFTVKPLKALTPEAEPVGEWQVCTPENAPGFSAVGYTFARALERELKVPVGILTVAYGASTAQSWIPRETMAVDPLLKPMLDSFDAIEAFYQTHPGATTTQAPPVPQTINGRAASNGALRDPVQDQHQPTVLYNGMLHPVVPYGIRGAIWYQGESVVGGRKGVELYPHVMETLVNDWRKEWGEGEFPFYAVQLAALKNVSNNPVIREQQARILALPHTGLAVTIDVGDADNVHPKNKVPVGERLALIALANTYAKKLEYSGPRFSSMKIEGSAIRLRFTHSGDGLLAKGGTLHWFQIAGSDRMFVDAEAVIEGDTVVVKSTKVAAPVAVRYAWDNYPEGSNFFNQEGLPAAPFRTDNWDALTETALQFTGK